MFSALMWLAIWLYGFLSKTLDCYNYESTCSAEKKMCGCWKNHFVSLGTESRRFSTVDYIPESFCIIDLKRHSEDRGGRLSDRLDPESHLSHIFLSATSSAYFCGRGKGIYDPWFPFQRKGNHFKFGSQRNNSRKGIEEFWTYEN